MLQLRTQLPLRLSPDGRLLTLMFSIVPERGTGRTRYNQGEEGGRCKTFQTDLYARSFGPNLVFMADFDGSSTVEIVTNERFPTMGDTELK